MAASRKNARLTPVDGMTLSRGFAAAVLVGLGVSGLRRRTGLAGWLGWSSLIYGSIVSDWLDGPIARRLGTTSELGAVLDLESDSWLTLVAASSAAAWGGLPAYCMAAPLARYALLMAALRRIPYRAAAGGATIGVAGCTDNVRDLPRCLRSEATAETDLDRHQQTALSNSGHDKCDRSDIHHQSPNGLLSRQIG